MTIMCRKHFEEGLWYKLRLNCEILWETFVHHHHEHKFNAEFVELLYMIYRYVLEHDVHAEHEIMPTLTLQFRDTCVTIYSASVIITMKALVELAEICMRSENHVRKLSATTKW